MKIRTTKTIIVSLVIVSLLTTLAIARPGRGESPEKQGRWQGKQQQCEQGQGQKFGRGGQMGPNRDRGQGLPILGVLGKLDLTEEQKAEVKTIITDSKEDLKSAREANREAMKGLQEVTMAGGNEAAIRAAAAKVGEVIGDKAVLQAKVTAKVKAVLTEEQLTKLGEIHEVMQKMRELKMGPGGPGQCPTGPEPAEPADEL